MFSSDKNHRIDGDLYTLRTITVFDKGAKTDMSRVQRRYNISVLPFISIPCLGVNDEAVADAQDTLTVRGFDVFDRVKLNKLYTRISNCNNEESQKEISRDLQYWSHYLAESMCVLMEKALKITGNKDLLKILNKFLNVFDNDYRSLSSVPHSSLVKEELNKSLMSFLQYPNEIKKLDVANSFRVFSNFAMASTSILNSNRTCFEGHKEFSCIGDCVIYCFNLSVYLASFAYNLAEICRCDEVKRDIELMRILYPVYKDVECFLKEGERVDLSSVQEKFKEECVRQTGLPEGAPSLDNHLARAEMQQVLSQAIKSVNGLLKVSEQNTFKLLECGLSQESELIGSLEAIAEVNESKKKLEKLCEKYGFGSIDSPKPQNTIEGQELKVTAQVGTAD